MDFPDMHDLSLDFLIIKLVAIARRTTSPRSSSASPSCRAIAQAARLAEEALGAARGHLESLEELAGQSGQARLLADAMRASSRRMSPSA